jgi:N-acetylneuraminic acid mutarotase
MKFYRNLASILAIMTLGSVFSATAQVTSLGISDNRTRDVEIIERLKWERRAWPSANASPRPSFEVILPPAELQKRVDDLLKKSTALAELYHRAITADDVRLELARMARSTKDPEALRAMFAALADDSGRIAETIVRPTIVDRLLRNAFSTDPNVHQAMRDRAIAATARARSDRSSCPVGAECRHVAVRRGMKDGDGASVSMAPGEWDAFVVGLSQGRFRAGDPRVSLRTPPASIARAALDSLELRRWTEVADQTTAFVTWRVEEKSPDTVQLVVASWRKQSFDAWWTAQRDRFAASAIVAFDAGPLPTLPADTCTPDTWSPSDPEFPGSRSDHVAVWDGSEMLIWGGLEATYLGDGWKYSPAMDSWSKISSLGAPSPRYDPLAVWTGTEMIVWGGYYPDAGIAAVTGGRYDPVTDSWHSTSVANSPAWRELATAVWSGTEMIVWGGASDSNVYLMDGARYNPSSNSWTALTLTGAPVARELHVAAWTGTEMIIWGGIGLDGQGQQVVLNSGGRYNPTTNTWAATSIGSTTPTARYHPTAIWTGTDVVVWGGEDLTGANFVTGGKYRPSTDTWTPTATSGAPTHRDYPVAVWTGASMVIWGGSDADGNTSTGGRYDPIADSWQPLSTVGAIAPGGTAVWTGTRMITFGGYGSLGVSHDGGIYDPVGDTWTSVRTTWRPAARSQHAAVWTGNEMIVWGGKPGGLFPPQLDAGRYEPATDTWSPITTTGAPADRWYPSTVWTGARMVVWGGAVFDPTTGSTLPTNGGGVYDPTIGAWTPMAASGQPSSRFDQTTVWTGTEMIVWGGADGHGTPRNDGGRYRPGTDTWLPVQSVGAPIGRRYQFAVWTGREMIVAEGELVPPGTTHPGGGRYDPDRDEWTVNSDVGAQRRSHGVGVWSGRELIVAFGDDHLGAQNTGERYDPRTDTWSSVPPCDTRLVWSGAQWACGRMLVWGDDSRPQDMDMTGEGRFFDPVSNLWTPISLQDAPAGCEYVRPVLAGTRLLNFGGNGPGAGGYSDSAGAYCACSSLVPLETPTLFIDKTPQGDRVTWYLRPEATYYDVVRGSLTALRSSGGNFALATTTCVANDLSGSSSVDSTTPAPGEVLWYVERPARPGESGTYDSGSSEQVASRDAGILASGNGCP